MTALGGVTATSAMHVLSPICPMEMLDLHLELLQGNESGGHKEIGMSQRNVAV